MATFLIRARPESQTHDRHDSTRINKKQNRNNERACYRADLRRVPFLFTALESGTTRTAPP